MCFSLAWLQQLFIWMIIVGAVIAILYILATYVMSKLPPPFAEAAGVISSVLRIVMWAIVAIFVIYVCFSLVSCLLSYAGGMPSLTHR